MDELSDVISSWVSYCENIVISDKYLKFNPNSNLWVSKSLKMLMNKKKEAVEQGSHSEPQRLQKEVKQS